jgi:hypothetical protein
VSCLSHEGVGLASVPSAHGPAPPRPAPPPRKEGALGQDSPSFPRHHATAATSPPTSLYWRLEATVARPSYTISQLAPFRPGRASALATPRRISLGRARSSKHVPVAMRALWSRALRTPGTCRCVSCAAAPWAVTRRTGATGVRGAWASGTPTSTFAYTAAFAAGLAMDARAKRRRNEQWDSAFENIQADLRALQQAPMHRPAVGSAHQRDTARSAGAVPSELDWDHVFKAAGIDMIDDAVFEKRQLDSDTVAIPEVLWDLLRSDARLDGPSLLDWPANTSTSPALGNRHNLPPQSLWSLESVRLKALRNRASRKKLDIQELSVCSLIHNLLRHFEKHLPSTDELAVLSPHIASVAHLTGHERDKAYREILANMKALETTEKGDWPKDGTSIKTGPRLHAEPTYFQDTDGDFHYITEQLNVAVKKLFEEYHDKRRNPEDIAAATAKICHNLLISTAAPNLQTFNILLTGFQKWEQPRLVDNVIREIDNCKIRPNEITCAAVLDHYTETGRPVEFSRFVAKMRGVDNALMLARPDVTVNEVGNGRLVRTNAKVYQKVYPTPMVFQALMHGVMTFAGFERAMDIYFEMKDDGWGLDIVGLSRFLDDCLQRADWQGGLIVWDEIASVKGRIKPELLAKAYAQFLSLCTVTQQPSAFNTVLNDVVKRGYNRKAILTSYREIYNAVQPKKGYLAPAWSADNLLIAVSDYMKTDDATEAETTPFFEDMGAGSAKTSLQPEEQSNTEQADPWSAWMEHELGEPMQTRRLDGATAIGTPPSVEMIVGESPRIEEPQTQATANEVDPWAAWIEHELHEAVPGKATPPDGSESIPKRSKGS